MDRRTFTAALAALPFVGPSQERNSRLVKNGRALRLARAYHGRLTIAQAASRIGVSASEWESVEDGKIDPVISWMEKAADAVNSSIDDLIEIAKHDYPLLCEGLRTGRRLAGLSVSEASARSGIPIDVWEAAEREDYILNCFEAGDACKALGVTVRFLVSDYRYA